MKLRSVVLAAAIVALAACSCEREIEVEMPDSNATLGQQLIDLKRALDEGAINHKQFSDLREDLIGDDHDDD